MQNLGTLGESPVASSPIFSESFGLALEVFSSATTVYVSFFEQDQVATEVDVKIRAPHDTKRVDTPILLKWYGPFSIFQLQIATDHAFLDILSDELVAGTEFLFTMPEGMDSFYWRYRGNTY